MKIENTVKHLRNSNGGGLVGSLAKTAAPEAEAFVEAVGSVAGGVAANDFLDIWNWDYWTPNKKRL